MTQVPVFVHVHGENALLEANLKLPLDGRTLVDSLRAAGITVDSDSLVFLDEDDEPADSTRRFQELKPGTRVHVSKCRRIERLCLLCEKYGIPQDEPECWLFLAYRLACEHEPGFKVVDQKPRSGGRPSHSDNERLARRITRYALFAGGTAAQAAGMVAKEDAAPRERAKRARQYRERFRRHVLKTHGQAPDEFIKTRQKQRVIRRSRGRGTTH